MKTWIATVLLALTLVVSTCCSHAPPNIRSRWSKNAIVWKNIPVKVIDYAKVELVKHAIAAWNIEGCELLELVDDPRDADVIIVRGGDPPLSRKKKRDKDAKVAAYWSAGRGIILMFKEEDKTEDMLALTHELGHALGLRHDYNNDHSIMSPSVGTRDDDMKPAPTEHDLVELHMRYCE